MNSIDKTGEKTEDLVYQDMNKILQLPEVTSFATKCVEFDNSATF